MSWWDFIYEHVLPKTNRLLARYITYSRFKMEIWFILLWELEYFSAGASFEPGTLYWITNAHLYFSKIIHEELEFGPGFGLGFELGFGLDFRLEFGLGFGLGFGFGLRFGFELGFGLGFGLGFEFWVESQFFKDCITASSFPKPILNRFSHMTHQIET